MLHISKNYYEYKQKWYRQDMTIPFSIVACINFTVILLLVWLLYYFESL